MAIISGIAFGPQLCKIFKLEPKDVSRIIIDVGVDDVVKILVHRYMTTEEAAELAALLPKHKEYDVVIEEKIDVR